MVQPVSDDQLANEGMQLRNQGRILLIACGALAREILAVMKTNDWQHMDLQCLPAIYHNTPDKITPAVKNYIEKYRDDYSQIFIVYADCGTGGHLQNLCDEMGVSMISGPHCYSFFEGNAAFEAREELTCFYLTDFLVRQFDAFFWRPMGLDKHPQLRDAYFRQLHHPSLSSTAQRRRARGQSAGLRTPDGACLRISLYRVWRFDAGFGRAVEGLLGRRRRSLHHARHHRPQPI
jgi:hypothetical protein